MTSPPREPRPDGDALRAVAVVPARLGSTRLPRKMLLRETGRYLFEHTVQSVQTCAALTRVVLATDSDEILAAAAEVGIEAVPTSAQHPSGTDRVHEAVSALLAKDGAPIDVVLNVQGDEPELPPEDLAHLVAAFRDPGVDVATLWSPLTREEEAFDPSVVKVVLDARGDALYFSRSPIPSLRHPSRPMRPGAPGWRGLKRHIGVYAFRPPALGRFCTLPQGTLETTENLEQLRWLEAGGRLRVLEATELSAGIDTREQYEAFRDRQRGSLPFDPTPTS